MTEQEIEEAKELYRTSKLTNPEKALREKFLGVKKELGALKLQLSNLQKECNHPLIMRETKNEGYSRGWDRGDEGYWTNHHCTLCELRWTTDQRWKYVDGGLGLPQSTLSH